MLAKRGESEVADHRRAAVGITRRGAGEERALSWGAAATFVAQCIYGHVRDAGEAGALCGFCEKCREMIRLHADARDGLIAAYNPRAWAMNDVV
jgi:hypothetical protein